MLELSKEIFTVLKCIVALNSGWQDVHSEEEEEEGCHSSEEDNSSTSSKEHLDEVDRQVSTNQRLEATSWSWQQLHIEGLK